ncbi:hypothetical protein GF340_05175 [Candidatus Peregrinibacteria bacterium]|nr:hypothetical protein [Candidatus Peregrinibacteria bacterium]
MIKLKQALDAVKLYENAYKNGIEHPDYRVFQREEELRTRLAQAIASTHPELNPDNLDDLAKVADLPPNDILSKAAQSLYLDYTDFLRKEFGLNPPKPKSKSRPIRNFADIQETFSELCVSKNDGQTMTWSPAELTAFHRLCVRLARDNRLSTDQVMSGFKSFDDLTVNEASIYLAERLFEILQS